MASTSKNPNFFDSQVLGHPSGLFVLFFTEMWERFSFYGMRVLLVNFLTMAAIGANPGWEWTTENAMALFGTYAGLLYLTPILGGIIADKFIGYRWAVVVGALLMTAGHASMALETEFSLYFGLALLVIGTGFFKPTMTSIISEMYKDTPEKKDGAYTIFYMGVNAGAFFGMLLCGYLAEKVGWSYGFGLAGVFMLLGTLQFWLSKPLFGMIGELPSKIKAAAALENKENNIEVKEEANPNPFTKVDIALIVITATIGLSYLLNDPISKIAGFNMFDFELFGLGGSKVVILSGLVLFLFLAFSRIFRYEKVVRDRMIAFVIFAFFTVFFWLSFEQGASSLVLFARDSVDRVMTGSAATAFNIVNALLTIVPLAIITWVLYLLWRKTFKKIAGSNIVLVICFAGLWAIVGWMLNRDFNTKAYEVTYEYYENAITNDNNELVLDEEGNKTFEKIAISEGVVVDASTTILIDTVTVGEQIELIAGTEINIIHKNNEKTEFSYLNMEALAKAKKNALDRGVASEVITAEVLRLKGNEVEITVSWFSVLNSFFIIAFASLFSKWWESKYNPSAVGKYALGLIIMAVGFGLLSYGSHNLEGGAKVSMMWLVFAYLFHTLGELCLSPVGLSYVSKLVPARMIAFMFGMWYLAIAIGNKLAAVLGGLMPEPSADGGGNGLSDFFLIFTIVPLVAGLLILALGPLMKKLMHGVK
jgi:POT family proton-dependent oligopeptide transporter